MPFLRYRDRENSAITGRLDNQGANPPPTRQRRITIETDMGDENNNSSSSSSSSFDNNNGCNNKLTYALPTDYKYDVAICNCERPHKAYECGNCHHYFRGRLTEICKQHPTECFLMDFRQCPYCLAPIAYIKESDLSLEQIRNIELAALPGDIEDL